MRAATPSPRMIRFGPFVANLRSGELHENGSRLKLQEKPFKILAMLLERAGEVVTREELREELWPDNTYVDFDHGINMGIAKIREALGESSEEPQFVETVGRRGYRFIAAVEALLEEVAPAPLVFRATPILPPAQRHSVGRKKECAELAAAFETAAAGRGLLVCVAGEPGIGKTTLVQDFLSGLQASGRSFDLAIGRCSQRLAGEEAYLPFLEALESLLHNDGATARKLRELAPSWYAQLFPLSESNATDSALQAYARGATQERVKRELAAFLCEITRQNPLILFFDDVHWTDPSTVDLLAYLGTRFDCTKLLVIVTYRPTEMLLLKHPFLGVKRELQARNVCREIEVEFLTAGDVERYIALEFLGHYFPREFAGLIHARTEGNPLFMVDLLRYLRDRKVIVKPEGDENWRLAQSLPDLSRNIPPSMSSVIERKIEQLSDRDREVLTAASVQGYECDSAAVARALEGENMEIEEVLDRLERVHGFVKRMSEDELPGGAPTVRYRFVHVLYQNALYSSLTPTRRVTLSAALAHTLEAVYGERSSTIASQLAFLYEATRDPDRSSSYFLLAAQNAARIFANREAIALARRGLALLGKMPETPERTRKELDLQVTLAFSLLWTLGYASPETGANMARARELSEALGDTASLFPVIWGLWHYYLCKGDLKLARETAEQMLSTSRDLKDPALILGAHICLAFTLEHQGELVASRQQFEEASKHYDFAQHRRYVQLYRFEPGIQSESEMVRTLWLLGFPDQARRKMEDTLARARTLAIPLSLAFAQRAAASLYQNLRLCEKAREIGEACITLCDEHGILLEKAWVSRPYGWAIAQLGGVEEGIQISRTGLQTQLSIGAQIGRTQALAVLGETLWRAGRTQEAFEAVEEGLSLSKRNGNAHFDAELWRLKGELLKVQDKTEEAERCFLKAIEIARQQAAKSLELRACTSLARFWQKQDKRTEARQLLSEIYGWFTEGFDTADLKEAASLLNELT
ncbi:MAG: AAA family ATPase [Acidobacteriia bacterium]|nr:AAA family ATPase [Terriglobia bacterium]